MTKCAFFVSGFFCCGYALQPVGLLVLLAQNDNSGVDFSPFCKNSKQQKHISLRLHLIKPFVSKAGRRVVFIAGFAVVASCQSLVPAFVVFAKCEASLA